VLFLLSFRPQGGIPNAFAIRADDLMERYSPTGSWDFTTILGFHNNPGITKQSWDYTTILSSFRMITIIIVISNVVRNPYGAEHSRRWSVGRISKSGDPGIEKRSFTSFRMTTLIRADLVQPGDFSVVIPNRAVVCPCEESQWR
jgi:hypothetical protein